jgi:hypothetical protein
MKTNLIGGLLATRLFWNMYAAVRTMIPALVSETNAVVESAVTALLLCSPDASLATPKSRIFT